MNWMSWIGQNFLSNGTVVTKLGNVTGGRGSVTMSGGGKIIIDGKEYVGNHIVYGKDGILIDGKPVATEDDKKYKVTSVAIHGNVTGNVESSRADVTVHGEVMGKISTQSGDVYVDKQVRGDVSTMSGDVSAHTIGGHASTMSGDIDRDFRRKK